MRTLYRFAVVFPECNSRQICEFLSYTSGNFSRVVYVPTYTIANVVAVVVSWHRNGTCICDTFVVKLSSGYPFALSLRAPFSFLPFRGRRRGNKRKTSLPSSGLINLRGCRRNVDLLLLTLYELKTIVSYDFLFNTKL